MREPGPLLASGRDADIFEYSPGRVLRRARNGRSLAGEARIMEHLLAHGYPVPAVHEISADGADLVMDRLDGVQMVDAVGRRPWTLLALADVLADLHHRLHAIEAPDWLPPAPGAGGDRVVHLDLHPLNVMVTASGPVVIDWPNASRGVGATDVALSWLLTASGDIPGSRVKAAALGTGRSLFVRRFLRHFDVAEVRRHLGALAEVKCADPAMSDAERAALRRIADRHGVPTR